MRSMVRRLGLAVCLVSIASPAAADLRVFEQNPPRPPIALPAEPEPSADPAAEPGEESVVAPVRVTPPMPAQLPPIEDQGPLDDHRWLDLTAFLQPGFIARLTGPDVGAGAGVTDDTFWLQRARFGFRARVFDWLLARLEVEFSPTTLLQDAYLDITPHPAFNVRLGQFVVPFLRAYSFNELNLGFLDRPIYTPLTPDRSYIRYLSPRDIGLTIWGFIGSADPDSHDPTLEYQIGGFVGRGPNVPRNDDEAFLWAGRLQMHLLGVPQGGSAESDIARNDHARVGVGGGLYSNCDDRANWNRGFTVDAEFRYQGLYMSGAVVWLRNSLANEGLGDALGYRGFCGPGGADGPRDPRDFVSRGAHFQVQYVLPRFWEPLGDVFRFFDLELMARVDVVDPNSPFDPSNPIFGGGPSTQRWANPYVSPPNYTDSDNGPTRYRFTFGLNFFPTGQQMLRLGINYQHNREAEDVVNDRGTFRGIENDIFWIQITAGI